MFNLLGNPQFNRVLEFYRLASDGQVESVRRFKSIENGLALIPQIKRWPVLHSFKRHRAEAAFLRLRADQIFQMPTGNIIQIQEQAIKDLERALALLAQDPKDLVWSGMIGELSVHYAQRVTGSKAENIEHAIELSREAKHFFKEQPHGHNYALSCAALAEYYGERHTGHGNDNIVMALKEIREGLSLLPKDDHSDMWGGFKMTEGALLLKCQDGNRRQTIEAAIQSLTQALEALVKHGMAGDRLKAYGNLAQAWRDRIEGTKEENFERAIQAIDKALATAETSDFLRESEEMAQLLLEQAELYSDRITGNKQNNIQRALESAYQALAFFKKRGDKIGEARADVRIANFLRDYHSIEPLDNLCEIEERLRSALKIYERFDDQAGMIETLMGLGNYHYSCLTGTMAENMESAIAAYAKIREFSEESNSDFYYVTTMNLANAYLDRIQGQYSENMQIAMSLLQQAHDYFDCHKMEASLVFAKVNLAAAMMEQETKIHDWQQEQALVLLEYVLRSEYVVGDRLIYARALRVLGNTLRGRVLGNSRQNRKLAMTSLSHAASICGPELSLKIWSGILLNLIQLILEGHANAEERDIAGQTLDLIFEKISRSSYPLEWARAKIFQGELLSDQYQLGNLETFESALQIFQECAEMFQSLGRTSEYASTQFEIGRLYALWHKFNPSIDPRKAIETFHCVSSLSEGRFPELFFRAQLTLGETYAHVNQWHEADMAYSKALHLYEEETHFNADEYLAKFVKKKGGRALTLAPLAALMNGDSSRALKIFESLRAVSLRAVFSKEADLLNLGDLQRLRTLLQKRKREEKMFDEVAGVERRALLQQMEQTKKAIDNLPRTTSDFDLASCLAEIDEWVFVPFLGDTQSKAVLISPRGTLDTILVSEGFNLGMTNLTDTMIGQGTKHTGPWAIAMEALKAETRDRGDKLQQAIKAVSQYCWNFFGKWIVQELEGRGVRKGARLVIIPQGLLGLFPISLSTDEEDWTQTLLDKYDISYAPSLTVLSGVRKRVAQIEQDPSLTLLHRMPEDLESSNVEAACVNSYFRERALSVRQEDNWNRQRLLESLNETNYWHFSTHGEFNRHNPGQSAIELNQNEKLTLEQLVEIESQNPPRLVVLSACETGLYDILGVQDEFVGLPAAFIQLGAAGVVGTLWIVNDIACALIMMKFYESIFIHDLHPVAALRIAQLWLRDMTKKELYIYLETQLKKERISPTNSSLLLRKISRYQDYEQPFSSPIFWGAFVFYGS